MAMDACMVEIAEANAKAAGVAGVITFKQMRVQDLRSINQCRTLQSVYGGAFVR